MTHLRNEFSHGFDPNRPLALPESSPSTNAHEQHNRAFSVIGSPRPPSAVAIVER